MRYFFQGGRKRLFMAAFALLAIALSSGPAVAQQDRDRPGRGSRRDRDRPGDRRGEDRAESRDENPRPVERSASSTPAPSANSFGTTSDADRARKWASDTVAKHDKNNDKILEGDELGGLGQSSRGADSNGDGKITVDELYQFSSKGSSSASTSSTAKPAATATATTASGADSADPKERIITNNKRKSYRFKSTKDRINNWRFSSRDANGDGQVSMSEYSGSWTDRTAAEFMRYDKDNDGLITAEEAK